MPDWKVTLTTQEAQDWLNAWGEGYEPELHDGTPNPQTKTQYAKARALHTLASQVEEYKKRQAHLGVTGGGGSIS